MEEFFDEPLVENTLEEVIIAEMEEEQGLEPTTPEPKKRGRPKSVRKENSNDYISNSELTEAITAYVNSIPKIEVKGKLVKDTKNRDKWPPISDYLANCFMKLINNCSNRNSKGVNFRNHLHLAEMQANAIFSCVKYCHNFDPNKGSNAFAYFTMIVTNAFLQVINEEKKQYDIIMKAVSESPYNYDLINLFDEQQDSE